MRAVLGLLGVAFAVVVIGAGAPGAAADTGDRGCAVTGYTTTSREEESALRTTLVRQPVHDSGGTRLDRVPVWVLPDGSRPLLAVDSVEPMTSGKGDVAMYGLSFPIKSGSGKATERYVTTTTMPRLGGTTRTIGLDLSSNTCAGTLVVAVDRSALSTLVGLVALGAIVLFGLSTVLLARRNAATWLRRALPAAPFGLLTGLGVAVLLYETGVASPFSMWPYTIAALGIALAGVLAIRPDVEEGRPNLAVTGGLAVAVLLASLSPLALADRASATGAEVATPEAARVIFTRTVAEARDRSTKHIKNDIVYVMNGLIESAFWKPDSRLAAVTAGVPRDQRAYPATFAITAEYTGKDGNTTQLFSRFERAAPDKPWMMTWLSLFGTVTMPSLRLDDAGYLQATPAAGDLIVDPAELSKRYTDWLVRSDRANAIDADPLLTSRTNNSAVRLVATDATIRQNPGGLSTAYTVTAGSLLAQPVPLSDGTAHVVFGATVHMTIYNRPNGATAACTAGIPVLQFESDLPGRFRQLDQDLVIEVEAWVPAKGLPKPASALSAPASPVPAPSGSPAQKTPALTDPNRVTLEDWNFVSKNKKGVRC
jgi:hypothetical protein